MHRYVKNAFANTTSTVGASFLTKKVVDIDTSTVVRLQIWDTAGQERYRSISKLYYRGKSWSLHTFPTEHLPRDARDTRHALYVRVGGNVAKLAVFGQKSGEVQTSGMLTAYPCRR